MTDGVPPTDDSKLELKVPENRIRGEATVSCKPSVWLTL